MKITDISAAEAAEAYQKQMYSLQLADAYIERQMSYVTRFVRSVGESLPVRLLRPQHVSDFYLVLPRTTASHNRALAALRGYIRFMERMKYLRQGSLYDLLGDRKTKKFTRLPKYYVPVSQFGPMIRAAGERHAVDTMTLALAFYTLGRQSEIAGLRLSDLDLDNETIRLYRPKRKRWTTVAICPELRDELYIWLARYMDAMGAHPHLPVKAFVGQHPDWYLVPRLDCIRQRGSAGYYEAKFTEYRLNPELPQLRLEKLVKRMLDIFGAQTEDGKWVRHKGEGMHTIRRSGARAMIDYLATQWGEDKALLMVSTMLDHETTTMTLLYIGRSLEQKRLNAYLATGSMYGDHGRSPLDGDHGRAEVPSNVTRLPVRTNKIGEVDAL